MAAAATATAAQTTTSKEELLHAIGDVVHCKTAGWYGFYLGDGCKQQQPGSLSLVITTTDNHRVDHSLPFRDVDGKTVWSLEYGVLVYGTPACTIQVVADGCDYHSAQWKWIPRHSDTVDSYKGGETMIGLDSHRKGLVCATCCKTFVKVLAGFRHYNDTHKVHASDSIWSRPLEILYHDDHMAIVNKPQGISIQGGEGKTLQRSDLLVPFMTPIPNGSHSRKPIIVHRLDEPTGGCLVMAKNKETEVTLRTAFATHSAVKKRYRAIVFGSIAPPEGVISEPISGKASETRYQVISRTRSLDARGKGWMTTVDCFPVTGRKHQIRRHLKHIGHPIWGDKRYGWYEKTQKSKEQETLMEDKLERLHKTTVEEDPHARLCLWAMEISVPHPKTGATVRGMLQKEPEWMTHLLEQQEKLYFASPAKDTSS